MACLFTISIFRLAQLGLFVILGSRDNSQGKKAVKQLIQRELDVVFSHLDISDHSHIDRTVHEIENRFGQIVVLVNNAAILVP